MVPELQRAVADAALVIPQRVDEGRDSIGLGTETLARIAGTAHVLRRPSVYWAGYVPDLFYLRDAGRGCRRTVRLPRSDDPAAYVAGTDVVESGMACASAVGAGDASGASRDRALIVARRATM